MKGPFWWPEVYLDMTEHISSCAGFQNARKLPTYDTNLTALVTGSLDTFSVDIGGPFKLSRNGKRFALIVVEHMTGWLIA